MLYKPDWEEAKARLITWWRGESVRRVAFGVMSPREKPWPVPPPPEEPADLPTRWLDPEYRFRRAEAHLAATYFGGVCFPYYDTHIGPGSLALYLGCEPGFAPDTVWYMPCAPEPEAEVDFRFDPDNRYWRAQLALIETGLARADGRFLVGLPDLIENLDILASVRGSAQLLLDLVDRPEAVHRWQRQLLPLWFRYYEAMYDRVRDETGGSCFSAFLVWAPGRMAKLQCDFSAMISPDMFAEFALPYLDEQTRRLDFTLYHLDGPEAIGHLPLLCRLERLNVIQWTPGAGQPGVGSERWYGLYETARAAGKLLLLIGIAPAEIAPLLRRFGRDGLLLVSWVGSESEARALEAEVDRL